MLGQRHLGPGVSAVKARLGQLVVVVCAACGEPPATEPTPSPQAQSQEPAAKQAPVAPTTVADDSVAAPAGGLCARICGHAPTLHCGAIADCVKGCGEMVASPACPQEMNTFLRCIAAEPIEHWQCDHEASAPAIRDGYCDAEQRAFFRCLEK